VTGIGQSIASAAVQYAAIIVHVDYDDIIQLLPVARPGQRRT
jgi:hypothetical protein